MPADATGTTPTGDQGSQTTESQATAVASTPTGDAAKPNGPISLTDDSLVTYEGAKEPVPFRNLRGLQSQFTKVSQARAQAEKALREREQRIQQLETAARAALGQAVAPQRKDPFEQIKGLPYLKGEEAAQMAHQIIGELSQRDQILQVMAQRIADQDRILSTLNRNHTTQSFDRRINETLKALGLDEDYAEEAKIFYLAHEGEDLDERFPEMFKEFLDKRKTREEARAAKKREEAKRRPFVPGKGGLSATTGEIDFAGKTPAQIADLLFDTMQGNETKT